MTKSPTYTDIFDQLSWLILPPKILLMRLKERIVIEAMTVTGHFIFLTGTRIFGGKITLHHPRPTEQRFNHRFSAWSFSVSITLLKNVFRLMRHVTLIISFKLRLKYRRMHWGRTKISKVSYQLWPIDDFPLKQLCSKTSLGLVRQVTFIIFFLPKFWSFHLG